MKQIQFESFGSPADVVKCVNVDRPTIAKPDEVLIRMEAFPINPADLLTLQGVYPRTNASSLTLGLEAAGVVEAIGDEVKGIEVGAPVLLLGFDNWSEYKVAKASEVIAFPRGADVKQLACLKVNPASAAVLLKHFVDLKPGDWFIQNAANSAVGRAAIEIAHAKGIKSVNVVRRDDVVEELKAIGADVVLVDGDDLATRVTAATDNAKIKLATECIGGAATGRLAECLSSGGTLVVYGAMSGEGLTLNQVPFIFHDIAVRGFWLTREMSKMPPDEVRTLFKDLGQLLASGALSTTIDEVFSADKIKDAVTRASEGGRSGKVLVTF